MTVTEYAALHKVSDRTVYRWIENGKISAEKRQGVWFITDFLENNSSVDNGDNLDKKDGDISDNSDNTVIDLLPHKIQSYEIQIEQLQSENEYLRKHLDQAQETIDNQSLEREKAQERSDTIIMQLTRQLENQNRMLEDLRDRSLWGRVKMALGFASS